MSIAGEILWSLSPWVPRRGPVTVSHIERGWLATQIAKGVPNTRIDRLEVLDGTSGTTDRRRLALHWNESGRDAGLPARVFIKSTPLTASSRIMVGPLRMAANEVRWYDSVGPELVDIAPRAYASYAARGARFLLVLEDLGERGCRPYSLGEKADLAHLKGLMIALGTLHARFWDSPRFAGQLSWIVPERQRPAHRLLTLTHRRLRKRFLEPSCADSPAVRRLAAALTEHEDTIITRREQGPLTLVHGDSHLGNTYRLDDGSSGLLDWQVVHRGQGLREVAYLLGSGAPIEIRRRHERELIALYLETLASRGVKDPPTAARAWDDYRFWISYAWDAVQLTRMWPGLQTPAALDASWARVCAAVEDLDVPATVTQGR